MIDKVIRVSDGSRIMVSINGKIITLSEEFLSEIPTEGITEKKTLSDKIYEGRDSDGRLSTCETSYEGELPSYLWLKVKDAKEAIKEFIKWNQEDGSRDPNHIYQKAKEIFGEKLVG